MKKLQQLCIETIIYNMDETPYRNELIPKECMNLLNDYKQFRSWEQILYFSVKQRKVCKIVNFMEIINVNYSCIHKSLTLIIEKNYLNCFYYLIKLDRIIIGLYDNPELYKELVIESINSGRIEILEYLLENFTIVHEIDFRKYTTHIFKFNFVKVIDYFIKKKYIIVEDFYNLLDLIIDPNLIQVLYNYELINAENITEILKNLFCNNSIKLECRILLKFIELGANYQEIKDDLTNVENLNYSQQIIKNKNHRKFEDIFSNLKVKLKKREFMTNPELKKEIYKF